MVLVKEQTSAWDRTESRKGVHKISFVNIWQRSKNILSKQVRTNGHLYMWQGNLDTDKNELKMDNVPSVKCQTIKVPGD